MKRILSLILVFLCLLTGFSAFGDVVFAPESDFYDGHRDECIEIERNFYSNGKRGYISLHSAPESSVCGYLTNAVKLRIFCTYKDWGMISRVDGNLQREGEWVRMSELYLIYDELSFREEFADRITAGEPLTLPESISAFYVYTYPGSKDPHLFTMGAPELQSTARFTDSEGRIWGRVTYYMGIRNQWICFSDPASIIPPFGGDPNLSLIESKDPPPEEPPLDEIPEESPLITPEAVPKHLPINLIALCLVAGAVIAAVVLIAICYKKEK